MSVPKKKTKKEQQGKKLKEEPTDEGEKTKGRGGKKKSEALPPPNVTSIAWAGESEALSIDQALRDHLRFNDECDKLADDTTEETKFEMLAQYFKPGELKDAIVYYLTKIGKRPDTSSMHRKPACIKALKEAVNLFKNMSSPLSEVKVKK